MRYFTLTYYKQPDGKINEVAGTCNNLKARDKANCNVILDFREEKIIKCTVNGAGLDVEWLAVIDYFSQYYADTFKQLVLYNNGVINANTSN
jgi:hypothetical protein